MQKLLGSSQPVVCIHAPLPPTPPPAPAAKQQSTTRLSCAPPARSCEETAAGRPPAPPPSLASPSTTRRAPVTSAPHWLAAATKPRTLEGGGEGGCATSPKRTRPARSPPPPRLAARSPVVPGQQHCQSTAIGWAQGCLLGQVRGTRHAAGSRQTDSCGCSPTHQPVYQPKCTTRLLLCVWLGVKVVFFIRKPHAPPAPALCALRWRRIIAAARLALC